MRDICKGLMVKYPSLRLSHSREKNYSDIVLLIKLIINKYRLYETRYLTHVLFKSGDLSSLLPLVFRWRRRGSRSGFS